MFVTPSLPAAFSACLSAGLKMPIFMFVRFFYKLTWNWAVLWALFPAFCSSFHRECIVPLTFVPPIFCWAYKTFSSLWLAISAAVLQEVPQPDSASRLQASCQPCCRFLSSSGGVSQVSALMARTYRPPGATSSPFSSLLLSAYHLFLIA